MTQILYTYINKKNHEFLMQRFLPDFSMDFQEKILRYRRWEDAQLTLLGKVLLKIALKENNIIFEENNLIYSVYNKPSLKDSDIKFNISHSGEIVICAITNENEIGIDIEKIHDINIEDFKFQMMDDEWDKIANAEDVKPAFFKYWTQKESVIKAIGTGLSTSLKTFIIKNNWTHIQDDFFLTEVEIDKNYKCYLAFKNKLDLQIQKPQFIEFDNFD